MLKAFTDLEKRCAFLGAKQYSVRRASFSTLDSKLVFVGITSAEILALYLTAFGAVRSLHSVWLHRTSNPKN